MTPTTPQDYRDRATECERLAETFEEPHARETMYYVAARWRMMADFDEQRERRNHLESKSLSSED